MPDLAHGTEWTQTGLRKYSNGDFVRIWVESYGPRIRLQYGAEAGDLVEWRWEMVLPMWDVAAMIMDLGFVIGHATKHSEANFGQAADQRRQLQSQVDRLKAGLPATEAEEQSPQGAEDQDGKASSQAAEQLAA